MRINAVAVSAVLFVLVFSSMPNREAYGNLLGQSHSPISIDGNSDFTLANGVVAGIGTLSDPYIIDRWQIDGHSTNGIEIANTNAYVVIRRLLVQSSIVGVKLENISNLVVQDSTFSSNVDAVTLCGSNFNISIIDNNITHNGNGIGLGCRAGTYVTISGNNLSNNRGVGIEIAEGRVYGTVYNNTISGNYNGLYAVDSAGHVKVTSNTFRGNRFGIGFSDGEVFELYHNNIIGNTYQVFDCCDVNTWDDGYPGGGNFWSDYSGVDNCSGSRQDVCPDPDGIGDTPYFATRDDYSVLLDNHPIMKPFLADLTGTLDVDPNQIVLKSKGKFVTAHIELPRGFDVANIILSSIRLNNSLSVAPKAPTSIGEYNHDGLSDLTVKFSLPEVKTLFQISGIYILQVGGNIVMNDGFASFGTMDYVSVRSG